MPLSLMEIRQQKQDDWVRQLVRVVIEEATLQDLDDAVPDWREITGAPIPDRPYIDPDVPYRKWLSTKDVPYQRRVNDTVSASVIKRSIESFQNETALVAQ